MAGRRKRISEQVARPVRTGAQGGVGLILAQFIDAWLYDMTDTQFGTLVAVLTVVISGVMTFYEDFLGKGFMRDVPSKEVPVVDKNEAGVWSAHPVWVILGIVGIVLIVLLLVGGINIGK